MNRIELSPKVKNLICILCLCIYCFSLIGCASIKKKFTRKKKKIKEVEPVLDPIDYPQRHTSVMEKYRYHYSIWKVWTRDILQIMGEKREREVNNKRQLYLMSQAIMHLEEMSNLLASLKNEGLGEIIRQFYKVKKEMERPLVMRNYYSMARIIERQESIMRNQFKPDIVAQAFEE